MSTNPSNAFFARTDRCFFLMESARAVTVSPIFFRCSMMAASASLASSSSRKRLMRASNMVSVIVARVCCSASVGKTTGPRSQGRSSTRFLSFSVQIRPHFLQRTTPASFRISSRFLVGVPAQSHFSVSNTDVYLLLRCCSLVDIAVWRTKNKGAQKRPLIFRHHYW